MPDGVRSFLGIQPLSFFTFKRKGFFSFEVQRTLPFRFVSLVLPPSSTEANKQSCGEAPTMVLSETRVFTLAAYSFVGLSEGAYGGP